MNKIMKKIFLPFLAFFLFYAANTLAANINYIDFTKVLNASKAGAKAQENLKKKFTSESNKFLKQEKDIKKEETEIISQKKLLSQEEYKKKVNSLRGKVSKLQKSKQESFNKIRKERNNAKVELLKNLNPILKKYMEDNNVQLIVEKQSIVLGDADLEITDKIIIILNKELSSLKTN